MLISENYRQLLIQTHNESKWGNTGSADPWFFKIVKYADEYKAKTILDYGAGWGGVKHRMLKERPDIRVTEYEPTREAVAWPAEPQVFVVCVDVLEHIEPALLDNVLQDLQRVILDRAYFSICKVKAFKILPDGRNAHLIVEGFKWWEAKLAEYFTLIEARNPNEVGCHFIVERKEHGL